MLGVALALVAAFLAGFVAGSRGVGVVEAPTPVDDSAVLAAVEGPDPDDGPREVVQRQLDALAGFDTDPLAAARCFALASPLNRSLTGPLDRFTRMLASPGYRVMLTDGPRGIGAAAIEASPEGERAGVVVTLLDGAGGLHAYRFLLSRQQGGPHDGCWMTEGVAPITPAPENPGAAL